MSELCNGCQRKGLAIFPALYAAAPKDVASLVPPSGKFGKGVTDVSLQDSKYFLRNLPKGYLYLLYPNKVWRGYLVDPEGAMLYFPSLTKEDMPDQPPELELEKTCCRRAHSSLAVKCFTIESPNDIKGTVWVAFSRHKWDKTVRNKIAKAPEKRMQAITKLDGNSFDHAEKANANLLKVWIANFNPDLVKQLNESLPECLDLVDLSGQEEEIAQHMLAHSGTLKLPGLILALHDPIGITASLNARRNTARGAETAFNKANEREIFSTSALRSLEMQAKKNSQLAEKWESTYKNAVRWESVTEFEKKLKPEREKFRKLVNTGAEDWVKWNLSEALQNVMDLDFGSSMRDSQEFRCAAMWTATGVGDCKVEREQWLPVAINPDNERNYLWRATILNQPDLAAFLKSASNQPTEYNAAKWLYSSLDQWLAKQDRLAELNQLQTAGLVSPYGGQTYTTAYNRLLLSLQMLQGAAQKNALKFIRATLLCAYLHGVELLPVKVEDTVKRIIGMQREVIWKPVGSFFEVRQSTATRTQWRVDISQLMQAADVQVTAKITFTQFVITRIREGTVWSPTNLFKPYELTLQNPNATPAPQGTPANIPKPPSGPGIGTRIGTTARRGVENIAHASRNWWADNRELVTKMVGNPYVGGSISSVALAFQAYSFNGAYQSLNALKIPTTQEVKNAHAAMASAAVASIGFTIEIVAAATQVAKKKAAQKAGEEAMKALAKRVGMIAGVGELVGAASGFVGVWQLGIAKDVLVAAGDLDAARNTMKQQIALGAASVASSFAGVTMAASAYTGTYVTFLGFGPVGWLLLAAAGTIALIWFIYETEKSRDDPMESWLKQCAFGKYRNAEWTGPMEQERYGKIFAIEWNVDMQWTVEQPMFGGLELMSNSFGEIFKLNAQAGEVSKHASLVLDIRFFRESGVVDIMVVIGPNGLRTDIQPPNMAFRYGEGARVSGKAKDGVLEASVEFRQEVPNPIGEFGPKLPANKEICTRVDVKSRYWPDQLNQPEVVLPSEEGRIDRLSHPGVAFIKQALDRKAANEKRAAECVASGRCAPAYGKAR